QQVSPSLCTVYDLLFFNSDRTSVNSLSISVFSSYVLLLTKMVTSKLIKNAGIISYIDSESIGMFPHTPTIMAPTIIPAKAPVRVIFFQERDNSTAGPNAPPKPAQANDTSSNIDSLFGQARRIATIATPSTAIRPKKT